MKVYAVIHSWHFGGDEWNKVFDLFDTKEKAIAEMKQRIKDARTDFEISDCQKDEYDYDEDGTSASYYNNYSDDTFEIWVEEMEVK